MPASLCSLNAPQFTTQPHPPHPRSFAYVTAGLCGLFAVLLGVGVFVTLRQPAGTPGVFLPAIYGSLGLFTAFWWMVASITFTRESHSFFSRGGGMAGAG